MPCTSMQDWFLAETMCNEVTDGWGEELLEFAINAHDPVDELRGLLGDLEHTVRTLTALQTDLDKLLRFAEGLFYSEESDEEGEPADGRCFALPNSLPHETQDACRSN
jgi:hypothetical protein